MTTYEYDDIRRLRLPDRLHRRFCKILSGYAPTVKQFALTAEEYPIDTIMNFAEHDQYKEQVEYLLANNALERAHVAIKGPSENFKKKVLDLWLKVIKDMSDVEKTLEGWDKI